ncbi:MAG: pyrroline-5-carboxylate reductase [Clostridia bacterium]|nr:pyrroline-5-carboxylate reductase [Clostridia bacterium]
MNTTVSFIGCGNMGSALARAVAASGVAERLFLCDPDTEKAKTLAAACGDLATVADGKSAAAAADFLFLAVKPQIMNEALSELAPTLAAREAGSFTLVSMAAGVSISGIEGMLGFSAPIIRIMPNTPCSLGAGVTVYAKNGAVTAENEATFAAMMQKSGMLDPLDESLIDAACALSGSGPAFVYLFAKSLAAAATACGLPPEKAATYAAGTLRGAADMLLAHGDPDALIRAVCSPGGTTLAGIGALRDANFEAVAGSAVTAAYRRAREMKK